MVDFDRKISPWGKFLNQWTEEDEEFEVETKQPARERLREPMGSKYPLQWGEPLGLLQDAEESPKIEEVKIDLVQLPFERQLTRRKWVNQVVVVRITTDTGITGEGHHLFPDSTFTRDIIEKKLIDGLIGQNPLRIEHIITNLIRSQGRFRRKHYVMYAIGAIDEALWDILGKTCDLPVYQLLGGYRDEINSYVSINKRTPKGVEDIWNFCADKGFNAIKLHTSSTELVKETRDIVGPDVKVMVDVGGDPYLNRREAVKIGRKMEEYDIYWYEDPLAMVDIEGFSIITEKLDVPVVTGARDTSRRTFREYGEKQVADIWNPDVIVCGGITEWMKIASLAEVYDIPITPHLNHLASMHVAAAAPNANFLEIITWELQGYGPALGDLLLEYPLDDPEDGWFKLPDKPGLGFEFDKAKIEEHRTESFTY